MTDEELDYTERYLRQIERCGQDFFDEKTGKIRTRTCKKFMCPKCGGPQNLIHRKNYGRAMRDLRQCQGRFLRELVFTIPEQLRGRLVSRKALAQVFRMVNEIIQEEFGTMIRKKKKKKSYKRIYRLNSPTVAILHLTGEKNYHPHINVLTLESDYHSSRILPKDILRRIREKYREKLEAYFRTPLCTAVVNYKCIQGIRSMRRCVWYMTKPIEPELPGYLFAVEHDMSFCDLLMFELKRFRLIRSWGQRAGRTAVNA